VLEEVLGELAVVRKKLRALTKTVIAWLEGLIEKYGENYKRRTKVTSIDEIDKKAVASANIRVSYDEETGFFGTDVRGSEFGMNVSEYDRILRSLATVPPHAARVRCRGAVRWTFDPGRKDFTIVWRDADRTAFGKRVHRASSTTYPLLQGRANRLISLGRFPARQRTCSSSPRRTAPEGARLRPGDRSSWTHDGRPATAPKPIARVKAPPPR
jgi:hypothetical protein